MTSFFYCSSWIGCDRVQGVELPRGRSDSTAVTQISQLIITWWSRDHLRGMGGLQRASAALQSTSFVFDPLYCTSPKLVTFGKRNDHVGRPHTLLTTHTHIYRASDLSQSFGWLLVCSQGTNESYCQVKETSTWIRVSQHSQGLTQCSHPECQQTPGPSYWFRKLADSAALPPRWATWVPPIELQLSPRYITASSAKAWSVIRAVPNNSPQPEFSDIFCRAHFPCMCWYMLSQEHILDISRYWLGVRAWWFTIPYVLWRRFDSYWRAVFECITPSAGGMNSLFCVPSVK